MKIGLLLFRNVIGGVETVNLELAHMLKSLGHDIFFIFPGLNLDQNMDRMYDSSDSLFRVYENNGVNTSVKSMIDFLSNVMNKEQPQLIISSFMEETYILLKAKKYIEKDFNIISVNHSGSCHQYKKFWGDRVVETYNKTQALVTITKVDELFYKKDLSIPVVTIPNMPRKEFYDPINSFDNNRRGKKIFSIGRLVPTKGFDILIKAFSNVNSLDWTLHIYGDGPEKDNLNSLIKELNLHSKVFLYPATKQVAKVMNEHEFFVFPSLVESYGMVLLESLMMGLPSISFDCPNGPAVIEADLPGSVVLVPNGDEQALAKEIEILIHNENRRKELSSLGVMYREIINKEKNLQLWMSLINQVT